VTPARSPLRRYLDGLAGSWRGLAAGCPSARVVESPGLLAIKHPSPVLVNAVLLEPSALADALSFLSGAPTFAVWTSETDQETAEVVAAAGLRPDTTTRPMVRLADAPLPDPVRGVELDAEPARVCRLNGVDPDLLAGVLGLRCVVTEDDTAGLAVQDVGEDVVLSFVATRPEARGRGLATAVTAAALRDAAERGVRGAVLQATPAAERLYARLGFVPVGRWREWVPPGGC
jgi:GNAT superfamily N-acetyltransferase